MFDFLQIFLFFFPTVRTNCVKFQQIPSVLANEKEDVTIQCSHDDSYLQVMLWYQKKISPVMPLIGYGYGATGNPYYDDEFKDRFKLSREDTLKGSLTISKLLQSDTAVYYCAASQHSNVDSPTHITKTSHTRGLVSD